MCVFDKLPVGLFVQLSLSCHEGQQVEVGHCRSDLRTRTAAYPRMSGKKWLLSNPGEHLSVPVSVRLSENCTEGERHGEAFFETPGRGNGYERYINQKIYIG